MSPTCQALAGQVVSPELVMIWLSSRKRQHDRYPREQGLVSGGCQGRPVQPLPRHRSPGSPVWPGSSRLTLTLPSRV